MVPRVRNELPDFLLNLTVGGKLTWTPSIVPHGGDQNVYLVAANIKPRRERPVKAAKKAKPAKRKAG